MKKPPVRTYPYKGLLRSDTYIVAEWTREIKPCGRGEILGLAVGLRRRKIVSMIYD